MARLFELMKFHIVPLRFARLNNILFTLIIIIINIIYNIIYRCRRKGHTRVRSDYIIPARDNDAQIKYSIISKDAIFFSRFIFNSSIAYEPNKSV